jgi:ribonuclease HII
MVVGIDEVGRGAWAGPLVVAAVSLRSQIDGLNDSKKLTATQREALYDRIVEGAEFIGVGRASPKEVDVIGLTAATTLACQRSIVDAPADSEIIIDGSINYLKHIQGTTTLVHGDSIIPAISAASIIAKVTRDKYMLSLSNAHKQYGFDAHVGYGTEKHREAIKKYGLTIHHRTSIRPLRAYV